MINSKEPNTFVLYNVYLNEYCSVHGRWLDIRKKVDEMSWQAVFESYDVVLMRVIRCSVDSGHTLYKVPAWVSDVKVKEDSLTLLLDTDLVIPFHDSYVVSKFTLEDIKNANY